MFDGAWWIVYLRNKKARKSAIERKIAPTLILFLLMLAIVLLVYIGTYQPS